MFMAFGLYFFLSLIGKESWLPRMGSFVFRVMFMMQ